MADLLAMLREGIRTPNPSASQTATPLSSAPTSDAERLSAELKRKDQLVAALTQRLEQAAEQLDRQNRMGESRGTARGTPGIPDDLLTAHQEVIADLRELAERWQASQADVALERIEQQLLELREIVAGNCSAAGSALPQHSGDSPSHTASHVAPQETSTLSRSSSSFRLGDESGHDYAPAVSGLKPGEPSQPEAASDETSIGLPSPVDFNSLQLADAITAICERDKCILRLREQIALATCSTECGNSPEEIRSRLAELEVIWQEKFRQHELSLSLERARLSREEAEMKQNQERLEKALRRRNAGKGEAIADGASGRDGVSRSRWMRFLGGGKGPDGDAAEA
jgi:hypothetical protein